MSFEIKNLGLTDYQETWEAMKSHVKKNPKTDELWITEHLPIYTTGINKKKFIMPKNKIQHLFVDRGGKITYHGPGQLIIYVLINLERNNITIRKLVTILEESVIALLKKYKIKSNAKKDAPGIYVNEKKIGSIGLRIKNGFTYHGLSINIDMDLGPFLNINPCGFSDLKMAQLSDFIVNINMQEIKDYIIKKKKKKIKLHYE